MDVGMRGGAVFALRVRLWVLWVGILGLDFGY